MSFIIGLFILILLCRIGFYVTGAFLSMILWVVFRLPLALFLMLIGILFCCTLLLIPLGIACFKGAISILF